MAHSADGKIEMVYYQFLAPMLLNEFQKQQRTIEAQAAQLAQQTAKLDKQAMEIAELLRSDAAKHAGGIPVAQSFQKLSAKPACSSLSFPKD